MVQAVGFLLGTTAGITVGGVALTTATGALTLAGSLFNLAGAALLNAAAKALGPNPATPENLQFLSEAAVGPRVGHVGRVKVGGNVVFHRAKAGMSYRVIVHGHGRRMGAPSYELNKVPVTLDGSGFVTDDPYVYNGRSRVQILARAGLVPETAYSDITAVWPEWTADHRLDGLFTSLIITEQVPAEAFAKVFPNGEPDLTVTADTAAFFDPRSGAVAYTENAALIIAGWAALPDTLNRPDLFDEAEVIAEADIADQDVALAEGGTEKRFRLSGSYLLSEAPQTTLQRMLDAVGGRVRLRPSGKVGLRLGAWRAPEFTLRFAHLAAAEAEVTFGPDMLDRFNVLPGRFVSRDLGFVEVDAEAWRDEAAIATEGQELVGPPADLLFAPSHRQARAALKLAMARKNADMTLRLACKPTALAAAFEDEITLDIPELGLSGVFEVSDYAVQVGGGLLRGVTLNLRRVTAEAFALDIAEQGAVQELPEPDVPDGVPVPTSVVAAAAGVQTSQVDFVAGIGVGFAAPPSDSLVPVVRYAPAGTGEWQDFPIGPEAVQVVIAPLEDGAAYDVSVQFQTAAGVLGDAATVLGVVAEASSTAPSPPTSLAVVDETGGLARVTLVASTSIDLWKTEIYRDAVLVGFLYSTPGAALAFVDTCGAGSFNWTAKAVNVSAKASTAAGPVAQTIT